MLERVERNAGWLITLGVLVLLGAVGWSLLYGLQHTTTLRLGSAVINATIADTDDSRSKGLSGRDKLSANSGLLMVYNRESTWGVWMKDMKFPIDIIWIDKNKKTVHITKNVYPDTYPDVFHPEKTAQYVLEVPAGTVDQNHIRIGQAAHFDLPSR